MFYEDTYGIRRKHHTQEKEASGRLALGLQMPDPAAQILVVLWALPDWTGQAVKGRHHYISVDLETEAWIYLFLYYATVGLTCRGY